ncbi:MAG: MFS transporter [Ectothiorhodospiraceae bacterium]|nr:MFS transporter [Chromatiales bacterium]MCP5156906.1 MFS transporter [Ectothiorhodospiraceae bacterium]
MRALLASEAARDPDYRRFWTMAAVDAFGMGGEQVTIGLLALQIGGSSAWVGGAMALFFAPMAVIGVPAGALADRMERRHLLRRVALLECIVLAVTAVLVGHAAVASVALLMAVVLSGSCRAVHSAVRASYAFDLVGTGRVVAGIGLLNLGVRAGQLVGALAAGLAYRHGGPETAYATLAIAHLLAWWLGRRLRSAGRAAVAPERGSWGETLRDYAREMRENRVLLALVGITAAVEILGFSFSTALPEIATLRLGIGADGLGLMHATRYAGGLTAALVLALNGDRARRGPLFLAVVCCFGCAVVLLGWAPGLPSTLVALALVAMLAAASDVLTQSMMQLCVADRLRGRAMGAWVLAVGTAPLGHLWLGALIASIGIPAALGLNGAALLAVGVLALLLAPRLRRL